ncbi:DUF4179 domain-containing protein [Clostridium felsineum]|uniref:DUF4179 domain-containing protein n=1 Tax=Clostridium felsineum TaxID=36839 RepID=A0A1S8LDX6_9CLOT|nr:DUF4179 domain-containing protein [Clostridium felsineum]URZ05241.1 hypothetical protein CLROS_005650 [Clostridium felsineum]URZ10282.1 hypothetical protein CROST_009900 [Clostridium felsineum]
MNTIIPENLMDNVEKSLIKHVKNKDKKRHMYKVVSVIISFLVILPAATFAYSNYNDNVLYKQSIDLARKNNDVTKVNKTFKYKGVSFNIKEIVADTTGIEVIYEVSDSKYSINKISFGDKDNKKFDAFAYTYSDSNPNSKQRSFFIGLDSSEVEYVKNNPVSIDIESIKNEGTNTSKGMVDKVKDFVYGKDKATKLEWVLKTKVPLKETKIVPVNKEYSLDVGTLKINSLRIGLFTTNFDYTFIPKDKDISMVNPMFSIRLGRNYVDGSMGESYGPFEGMISSNKSFSEVRNGVGENSVFFGTRSFKSLYYKKPSQIGIKLIALNVEYKTNDSNKSYKIDKNKLPIEISYNGESFKITHIKENKDSIQYNIEYSKNNRIYNEVLTNICEETTNKNMFNNYSESQCKSDKVKFVDQISRDAVYNSLVKKVPNLYEIEKHEATSEKETNSFQNAVISTKITLHHKRNNGPMRFVITGATKKLIYNVDELIINNYGN